MKSQDHTNVRIPDADVVRHVLAGERELFRLLVRRYELMVRSFFASQLYRLDDVDDLAQDTFISAYNSLETFDISLDFGVWLRGIARNLLLMHFRTVKRREDMLLRFRREACEIMSEELESEFYGESSQRIEALLLCVEKLPKRMLHVVRSGLNGIRSQKIAEELSTTVSAIYNLQYRANKLLRSCVEEATSYE